MKNHSFWSRNKLKSENSDESNQILLLPVDHISPNPAQPRKHFDEVDIVSLADSIRQHGLIQPISVRRSSKSTNTEDFYYCIAGERRLRAFVMLGKEEIPCILVDTSPSESAELAIIENVMRKDLNIFEYAAALSTLIDKYHLTQENLAIKMSTSQSNIANKLRLLRFTPDEQALILDKGLTERHARSILRVSDSSLRLQVIQYVSEHNLNVKDTEKYIDCLLLPKNRKKKSTKPYCADDFCRALDKTVSFVRKKGVFASAERTEDDEEIRFLVRIKK